MRRVYNPPHMNAKRLMIIVMMYECRGGGDERENITVRIRTHKYSMNG